MPLKLPSQIETEESLKQKGIAYLVGRARYQENARGRIIGDQDGFLKLLFRQEDLKLIGVHIMGELATEERIQRRGFLVPLSLRKPLA
jgi:pyruvate/2-oxoglutarate dehydrogenase complex dihydrolipoamide dehydrogenase (E3) component